MDYTNKMKVIFGDATLGLKGNDFQYIFSYEKGGLESMEINGKQWLYRVPTPTFWRATTDNDRGSGFNIKAVQWLGSDMFTKCKKIELSLDEKDFTKLPIAPANNKYSNNEFAENLKITFWYQTLTIPSTDVTISYNIDASGEITVYMHYFGKAGMPPLPVVGIRFIMPTIASGFDYDGLSGETYPDRMAGAVRGHYHINGLPVTKYLVPQENGMHMLTDKLLIYSNCALNNAQANGNFKLEIKKDQQRFNFSLLPYTAEELENATHIEELPPARRSVLVIAGAVRGVGGIDSWGSDVEDKYQINSEIDHEFSFKMN